jgi:hypothetical protein
MADVIQRRGDTAANWTTNNPVIPDRQLAYETDTGRHKWGDGSTAWSSLPYAVIENSAVALVDGAAVTLTSINHTLASSQATITFTITYTGDDITLIVTLTGTSATYTFPAGSLCVSDGAESGDNTLAISGTSGDKYVIAIKKVGSVYYVVGKNFGQ